MDPFTWNASFHCLLCSLHHPSALDIFDVDIHEIRNSQPELVHLLAEESQEEVLTKMLSDVTTAFHECSIRQSALSNTKLVKNPKIAEKFNELASLFSDIQTDNKKKRRNTRANSNL